jgi:hypothetical protein
MISALRLWRTNAAVDSLRAAIRWDSSFALLVLPLQYREQVILFAFGRHSWWTSGAFAPT